MLLYPGRYYRHNLTSAILLCVDSGKHHFMIKNINKGNVYLMDIKHYVTNYLFADSKLIVLSDKEIKSNKQEYDSINRYAFEISGNDFTDITSRRFYWKNIK